MLEFLRRHHKTLWIVVTAVVIVSFAFFGAMSKTGNRGGVAEDAAFFTIYGRDYDVTEFKRLSRLYELADQLNLGIDMPPLQSMFRSQFYRRDGLSSLSETLTEYAQKIRVQGESVPVDFALNLLMLRHELEARGIRASDAEAKAEFRALPIFQVEGRFDGSRVERFENNLGSFGMTPEDVMQLMRDWLGMKKLIEVVAGNTAINPTLVEHFYSASYQTIKAATVNFDLEAFKKAANVGDDEIKKYFDQKKDQFRWPEKRAVSYVFFENPKDTDKLPEPERMKKSNEFNDRVGAFANASVKPGVKFDDVAKELKVEVKKVPAFAQPEPPEALKSESSLVSEIFLSASKTRPISDPVKGSNGYYFFTVTAVEESKPQELKDATAKIKETLVAQKAQEEMTKAANDAKKALEAAVKGGKKIEDAAKEAKVEVKDLPEFTGVEPPKDIPGARGIAGAAEMTAPGAFSKPVPGDKGGLVLVFVKSKELRKRDESAADRQKIDHALGQLMQREVFRAWFDKRRDEADAKVHFRTGEEG